MAGEDVGSTDYKPDWNPPADVERPVLKTWWGPVVKTFARGAGIASAVFLGARVGGPKFAMGTTKAGGLSVALVMPVLKHLSIGTVRVTQLSRL